MDRGASYYDRLQALAAAGTPPGAFRLEPAWFAALAGKGLPAQLDAYVAAQKYPLQDDWSALVASYRWQGALMALPELGNAQVILYNPGLFAKASVPDPNAADATRQWTWPTMLSAAQRLTRGSGATQQFGFAFDATIERLLPWIWSNGGQMFTDDAKPTTLDMGNSNTVQAIQWLADMGTRFHVAPTPAEQQGMSLDALFAAGRLAMYATVTDMAAVTRQVNGAFAWDMTPLPVGNAGRFNLAGGSAYGITAASTSAEIAWAFLAYAGGPAAQQQYAQRAIGVPARQSLTGAGWLDAPAPPAHRQPLMTGMQEAKPIPPARRLAQLTAQAIDPQLALLWSGQVDAKTTLAAVDQKGNAILDGAT